MGAPQYDGGHRTCTMGTSGMLGAPVMLGILNFLGFLGILGKTVDTGDTRDTRDTRFYLGILGILGGYWCGVWCVS